MVSVLGLLEDRHRGIAWRKDMTSRDISPIPEDSVPNPSCCCGCGLEVAKPWHKQIIGHSLKKYDSTFVVEVRKRLRNGESFKAIAAALGCSGAFVSQVRWGTRDVAQKPAQNIMRASDILDYCEYQEMKKALSKMHHKMSERKRDRVPKHVFI